MATHRVSLLNHSAVPTDGNCFFSPYSAENSGTTQDPIVLHMITSVVSFIQGVIRVPENYVGTPVLSIFWTSETTTNTVDFKFRHRTVGDGELLDIATSPTELEDGTTNNGGPATASHAVLDTITLTSTDLTAGQLMYFEFERDGDTDDKVDTITVWGLHFQYADA